MTSGFRATLLAIGLALTAGAQAASAFSVSDPASDGIARTLDHTQRWEIADVLDGLDYVVHDSVCNDLRFVDGSSCDQVKAAIRETFGLWARGHAYLHFNDVSATEKILTKSGEGGVRELGIASMRAVKANGLNWRDKLKEEVIGYAYVVSKKRRTGNSAIENVLISIDEQRCFYLDFDRIDWSAQASCSHPGEDDTADAFNFRAVLAHEIGHALGLDHPDLEAGVNFDDDDVRDNAMAINCEDPASTLKLSPNLSVYSVMNRSSDYPIERGLSYDDLAGRDFLYPACETSAPVFDASLRGPLRAIMAFADDDGLEAGALSSTSWDPVNSMRAVRDGCARKYSADRCRFVGATRGWAETATSIESGKAANLLDLKAYKLVVGFGDSAAAASADLKSHCENASPVRLCLPVGIFEPSQNPPPWLLTPDQEKAEEEAEKAAAAAAITEQKEDPALP